MTLNINDERDRQREKLDREWVMTATDEYLDHFVDMTEFMLSIENPGCLSYPMRRYEYALREIERRQLVAEIIEASQPPVKAGGSRRL